MLIIKNMLKKHDVDKFLFVQFYDKEKVMESFVVEIEPLNAYDLINKKMISNFGYLYKKPLTDFVGINDDKISSIKAKKLARPFFTKFKVFCEEQEDLNHPKFESRKHSGKYGPNDIVID